MFDGFKAGDGVCRGLIAGVLGTMISTALANGPSPQAVRGVDYASDHIIVKFARGVVKARSARRRAAQKRGYTDLRMAAVQETMPAGLSPAFQETCRRCRVKKMRRLHPRRFRNPESATRLGLDRTYVLQIPEGSDAAAVAAAFAELAGEVEYAEVAAIGGVAEGFIPNDSDFVLQYGLHNTGQLGGLPDADIDAPEAWKIHTGDLGTVTVAIVDSGVWPNHPEYRDRLVPGMNTDQPDDNLCNGGERDGSSCCPGGGLCYNDGTCAGGTRDGLECCPGGVCIPRTDDLCPHGTHVAGIVAAAGNNGMGVAGVSWGANIMPVRVLGTPDGCSGTELAAATGIIWAVDNGADIINVSLQYCAGLSTFRDAIDYAHDNGVLVVSAAGNHNAWECAPLVTFPARFANSMAVTGTTDEDLFATFETTTSPGWSSNFGQEVDVCAPADRIRSTWIIPEEYAYLNGTSMAAPHVSGVAALLKSYAPALTGDEIRDIIIRTADDLGPEGWDEEYGYGRVNAYKALLGTGRTQILSSLPPDGSIDARQPSAPDGSGRAGWQWVDLLMSGDLSAVDESNFTVEQEGGVASAPYVIAVQLLNGDYNVRVVLSSKVSVGAWTTITYTDPDGSTSVRLGFLPGDVDGNGVADETDVSVLIDAVKGVIDPLPIWSTDINRSGRTTAGDILREVDLLIGAESFDAFGGTALP